MTRKPNSSDTSKGAPRTSDGVRLYADQGGELHGDQGWVLAVTALMIIPLLAFTSFSVDLGAWYSQARKLQRAADSASLAAAPLLPDTGKAKQAAIQSLIKNGICTSASTVTIPASCTPATNMAVVTQPQLGSTTKYEVDVQDTKATQYFSKLFKPSGVDIMRRGTAERIKPVPMGSPRNYLGTHTMFGTEPENIHLAISDYCTGMERGDRIASRADNDGAGATRSCVPGNPAYVRANPEYSPDGYFYAVEFAAPITGNYKVQFRFGCSSSSDWYGTQRIRFRDKNSNDPLVATVLNTVDLTNATPGCSTDGTAGNWIDLATVTNPTAGAVYYIQVNPLVPPGTPPGTGITAGGHMHFALRASQPAGFTRCTADASAATPANPSSAACPKVFALRHMGIRANITGSPTFFLASVGAEHAGKVMTVELFDPAEGANTIELIPPVGTVAQTVEAEIGCKDATYRSESGSCTTGETAPAGGYGPWNLSVVDVSGTGAKAFANLSQDGKYSDRHLRLKFTLPLNYAALYGSLTWWKIRYTVGVGGVSSDRTTWTVAIKGDPVRLVPNA